MVKLYVVITTRNRHEELRNLLGDIGPDVETIIVDNDSYPPIKGDNVIEYAARPPSISRMWNLGIDEANYRANGEMHDIAVLNDDLRIGGDVLEKLSQALRLNGAAVAFPDIHNRLAPGYVDVCRHEGPYDLYERMSGFCWMLRGELGLRLDESMRWWYSDDDLEWRASTRGGVARVGGLKVEHLHPNSSTNASPALAEQTGVDRHTFMAKWGRAPW